MQTKNTNHNLDLSSAAFIANPYPAYQILRERDTPYWLPFYSDEHNNEKGDNEKNNSGMWMLAKYHDVNKVLLENRRTTNNVKAFLATDVSTPFEQTMLQLDAPDHTRHRKIIADHFKIKNLQKLQPDIEKIIDDCLRQATTGGMDFMADFAQQIPFIVTAKLLGIPLSDIPLMREWTLEIANGLDYISSSQQQRQQQSSAMQEMQDYFAEWLNDTHRIPEDSLSYTLLQAYKTTKELNKTELLSTLVLLLVAGHENISNTLGNGLLTLLQHPQQKKLLIQNPHLIDSAIEEILRYETPLQRPVLRIVTDELKVGDHIFNRGDSLSVLLGSANRDEAQFKHADVFDIRRKPNRHLAFGTGMHTCLGAYLGRIQLRATFLQLFNKQPNIRLATETIQWRPLTLLRGLQTLPVLF